MDPHANLKQQRELAREIITLSDSLPPNGVMLDEQADELLTAGSALAEHVLALDDWRLGGGFDPYANTATRT